MVLVCEIESHSFHRWIKRKDFVRPIPKSVQTIREKIQNLVTDYNVVKMNGHDDKKMVCVPIFNRFLGGDGAFFGPFSERRNLFFFQ
jgi:hypothetical protein